MSARTRLLALPLMLLDAALILLAATILGVIIGGGFEFSLGRQTLRAYSTFKPFSIWLLLAGIRYLGRRLSPFFLGFTRWDLRRLPERAGILCSRLQQRLSALTPASADRIVLVVIALAFVIKVLNAWFYYGFYSGDDVEVQEMSLAPLSRWPWRAWELRSPFYPLVFLHPFHAALKTLGVNDPAVLVFAGRLPVILFSSLSIWLTYRLAARTSRSLATGVAAAFFLAAAKLHLNFASSELPRTVSSAFLLAGLWWLLEKRKGAGAACLAGAAFGVAGAIRFSEIIFLAPLVVHLAWDKRWRQAFGAVGAAVLTFMAITAVGDWLYWGSPFFSLRHIVEFTLIQKASSRGYQSLLYYLTHFPGWTDVFVLGLLAVAARLKEWRWLLWAVIPLVLLSILPHKEARYLIPILPFVAIAGGIAFLHILTQAGGGIPDSGRRNRMALAAVMILLGSLIYEAGEYHFRRSESAVDLARYVTRHPLLGSLVIQDGWPAGGRIYLGQADIRPLDSAMISDPAYVRGIIAAPGVAYIGLKHVDVERYGLTRALREANFREIAFQANRRLNRYRLFGSPGGVSKKKGPAH